MSWGGACAQPWVSEKVHRPGYQLLQCCPSVPPLALGGRSYPPEQKQWNLKSFRSAGANVSFSEWPGYCRRCRVRGLGGKLGTKLAVRYHREGKELVGLQRVGHYWATHTHTHTTPAPTFLPLLVLILNGSWKTLPSSVLIKCIFVDAIDKIYFS